MLTFSNFSLNDFFLSSGELLTYSFSSAATLSFGMDTNVTNVRRVTYLVLDEADRMIADGHFKEMRDILAHIYTQRLQKKTAKKRLPKEISEGAEVIDIGSLKEAALDNTNFYVGKNLEKGAGDIDWDNVEDLYDDDNIFEEIKQEGDIILDQNKGERENEESKKKNKQKTKS